MPQSLNRNKRDLNLYYNDFMSFVKLKDVNIYYEKKGKHGKDVILLHGWGQNTIMMDAIAEFLKEHFVVYNLDLPGFGKSQEPKSAYSIDDYVELLKEFVDLNKINNPILIGHSFGCRIALLYAYKYPVNKMCLTGAAGIVAPHDLNWYLKVYTYKAGKVLFKPFKGLSNKLKENAGSSDYKNASEIMKATLVKAVNFDISPYLKDIKPETLLVFGANDEATPLWMGEKMEKEMPDATLVVFENDDHFAYFHQAARFNLVLDAFLRRDYD